MKKVATTCLILAFSLGSCDHKETAQERYERRLKEVKDEALDARIEEFARKERGDATPESSVPPQHLTSVLSHQQEEDVALSINLAGYLCGKFVGAQPVGGMILAECQEYRKKSGHYVRYWIRGLGEGQNLRVEKATQLGPSGWVRAKR